jgi:predicted PhzF superfamily epimerase YddE/YHI9
MFTPALGSEVDPATGSGAAALAGTLAARANGMDADVALDIEVEDREARRVKAWMPAEVRIPSG